jgi:heme-binding protein
MKEATMSLSPRTGRRAMIAGTTGIAAALMFCAAPAFADPPPNCTAADLAGVASGVAAATSAYLFTHPDVNAFFTGLKGKPRDQISDDVQNYLSTNPQAQADLQGIRQPMVDFKSRCQ